MAVLARAALIGLATFLLAATEPPTGHAGAGLLLRAAGGGALELRNDGARPVTIDASVAVEQKRSGMWTDTHVTIRATATCFAADGTLLPTSGDSPSVTLASRQRMKVVPWQGYSCRKQCLSICSLNFDLGSGPFRFVATMLPGGEKVRSNPFTMPRRPIR